jgi:hypothetical protein
MTPTGCAVMLLVALVMDYMSIGADSWRDRLAFLIYLATFRVGWDGSSVDKWTLGWLETVIQKGLDSPVAHGAYIASASAHVIFSVCIGLLGIYAIGCLLPLKAAETLKVGRLASYSFARRGGSKGGTQGVRGTGSKTRINTKLLIMSILLALFVELVGGLIGAGLMSLVNMDISLVSALPNLLFGVK